MMRLTIIATAILFCVSIAHATQLLVVDSKAGTYLRSNHQNAASLDRRGVASLLSALTGLLPPVSISEDVSKVIDSLLKPSPFAKPRACIVLNIAGLSADDLYSVFAGRTAQSVVVEESSERGSTGTTLDALVAVASANPNAAVVPAEQLALLQDCGPHCVQLHLDALLNAVSAELAALDVRRASSGTERLFAVELANVLAGVRAYLQDAQEQAHQEAQVVEVTLLGLQRLLAEYGSAPQVPQVAVARAAVLDVLRILVAGFDAAFDGDVTYQVTVVDTVPQHITTMAQLLNWKESSRKQLLQLRGLQSSTFPGPNEAAMAKSFSVKAAAYGGFILLLYFALAAVYCMCNMPFKTDTVLFGRTKAE